MPVASGRTGGNAYSAGSYLGRFLGEFGSSNNQSAANYFNSTTQRAPEFVPAVQQPVNEQADLTPSEMEVPEDYSALRALSNAAAPVLVDMAASRLSNPTTHPLLFALGNLFEAGVAAAASSELVSTSKTGVEHIQIGEKHYFHVYIQQGWFGQGGVKKLGTVEVNLATLVAEGTTGVDELQETLILAEFLAEHLLAEGEGFGNIDYVVWSKKPVEQVADASGTADARALDKIYKLGRTMTSGDSLALENKGIKNRITAGQILTDVYNEMADRGEEAIYSLATLGAAKFFLLGYLDEVRDEVKLIRNGTGFDVKVGENILHHIDKSEIRRIAAKALKAGELLTESSVKRILKAHVREALGGLARNGDELTRAMKKAGQLRSGQVAHHLISVSVAQRHPFTQRAALFGWKINELTNGMSRPLSLHPGGHTGDYYGAVRKALDNAERQWMAGIIRTPQQVLDKLRAIENTLRQGIGSGRLRTNY